VNLYVFETPNLFTRAVVVNRYYFICYSRPISLVIHCTTFNFRHAARLVTARCFVGEFGVTHDILNIINNNIYDIAIAIITRVLY